TADGALNEVSNLLTRAASLADQAATSTNTGQYGVILNELTQLYAEIDRIGAATSFNGTDVFSATATDIFVGDTQSASTISFTTGLLTTAGLLLTDPPLLATTADAQAILVEVEAAIDTVAASRGTLGAFANRLENAAGVIQSQIQNLTAAESQIRDANIAEEVANLTKFQILQQTGIASLAQANQSAQSVLALFQ
ncbi:MAG: flagellin, partial [Acidobacteriota bacterium]